MTYHTLELQGLRHRYSVPINCSQESIDAMREDGIDIQEVIEVIEASDELVANYQAAAMIAKAKAL